MTMIVAFSISVQVGSFVNFFSFCHIYVRLDAFFISFLRSRGIFGSVSYVSSNYRPTTLPQEDCNSFHGWWSLMCLFWPSQNWRLHWGAHFLIFSWVFWVGQIACFSLFSFYFRVSFYGQLFWLGFCLQLNQIQTCTGSFISYSIFWMCTYVGHRAISHGFHPIKHSQRSLATNFSCKGVALLKIFFFKFFLSRQHVY